MSDDEGLIEAMEDAYMAALPPPFDGPLGNWVSRDGIRAALAVVREREGWRPIETAPRDGQILDLWSPDVGVCYDVWWSETDGWCAPIPTTFTHWRIDRGPDGRPICDTAPPEGEA